ncbi:MAG: serine/threonine-protein kinase [Sandaracinaceae bacterium]
MTTLGAYQLGERIAVGGMAEIFRARSDAWPDVVVKRLLPQYARDPEVVAMLAHEGRLMQRLAHPALIRVVEVSADSETPFLVLERIDGVPLSELMDEAVTPAMALAIVRPILDALGHVHAASDDDGEPLEVVHRDVTPHNVMVDRNGHVRLGDFGIARSSLRDARTRTGMIKGKLRYLAPEQVTGSSVDARTDLYAVGLVLFELVSGEPFLAADTEPALIRLAEAPTQRSCGHPALDKVLKRALARFPETRPRDAAAFVRALDKAVGEPADADAWASRVESQLGPTPSTHALESPVSAPTRVPPTTEASGRRRLVWGAALGLVAALALGLAWQVTSTPSAEPHARGAATGPTPLTEPAVEPGPVEPAPVVPGPVVPGPVEPVVEPTLADPPPAPVPAEARPAPSSARRPVRPASPAVEAPAEVPVELPVDPNIAARASAQAALARIDAGLLRRGIRSGDLAPAQRSALMSARRAAASGAPDLDALAVLEASLADLVVDEAFVRRKLQRVDARIRAARDGGADVTDIERRSALALQSLLEHRPAQTNERLNAILDRLGR